MLGARPPRPLPADFAVAQFIEDLALDTDVHATPLLTLRGHAQIYRFSLGRRRVRVCIAHVPLDHVRALDERDRFVSIAIRNVLIDGIDAPWPLALDAVAHRLTGERRIYTGPGVWERL